MLHTPLPTKLKGDLLLELRDIRLEINKENSLLEIVRKKRADAESSFIEREKKVSNRESAIVRLEEKFGAIVDDSEAYVKSVDSQVKSKKNELSIVKNDIERNKKNEVEIENRKKNIIKQLDTEIADKKEHKESILENVIGLDAEIISCTKERNDLLSEIKSKKDQMEVDIASIAKREAAVSEREIICENRKSDLRLWEVRLNKKYGHLLTEHEKKLIEL